MIKNTYERVNEWVGQMTMEEKSSQMVYPLPAIERLGMLEEYLLPYDDITYDKVEF